MHIWHIRTLGKWNIQGIWAPWQRGLARAQVVHCWEYLTWKYMRQRQGHCCASCFNALIFLALGFVTKFKCGRILWVCIFYTRKKSCLTMLWDFYFFNQVHGNSYGLKPQTLPHKWHHGNVSTKFNLLKSGLRITAASALALEAGVRPPTVPAQKASCQYETSLRFPQGAK